MAKKSPQKIDKVDVHFYSVIEGLFGKDRVKITKRIVEDKISFPVTEMNAELVMDISKFTFQGASYGHRMFSATTYFYNKENNKFYRTIRGDSCNINTKNAQNTQKELKNPKNTYCIIFYQNFFSQKKEISEKEIFALPVFDENNLKELKQDYKNEIEDYIKKQFSNVVLINDMLCAECDEPIFTINDEHNIIQGNAFTSNIFDFKNLNDKEIKINNKDKFKYVNTKYFSSMERIKNMNKCLKFFSNTETMNLIMQEIYSGNEEHTKAFNEIKQFIKEWEKKINAIYPLPENQKMFTVHCLKEKDYSERFLGKPNVPIRLSEYPEYDELRFKDIIENMNKLFTSFKMYNYSFEHLEKNELKI